MSAAPSRRLTHMEAVIDSIASAMREDPRVFYIGQDVGAMGGSMQGTKGLIEEFGPKRIREAPISESAMVGAAVGAALFGQRPIVEISFGEFLPAAMNQLINQAPNLHYMSGGSARVPIVVRTRVGDGPYGGHPQDYSAWFAHVPGIKVALPSTAMDAKAMMKAAIRDDNPVLFFEHKQLYRTRWPVPDAYRDPEHVGHFGRAVVRRTGTDLTVVATLTMVHHALAAAQAVAAHGLSVEVIDPCTLVPFDTDTLVASVRKTGRLLVVDEAYLNFGIQAEVIACVTERAFDALKAAPRRLGNPNVPVPFAPPLQDVVLPGRARIEAAIREMLTD